MPILLARAGARGGGCRRARAPGALGAPERAYQWETLVLGEHRGRRLGTLVKLACLREIAAGSPARRYVSTWTAP